MDRRFSYGVWHNDDPSGLFLEMNSPYHEGRRAAQKGGSLDDNPYTEEESASQWEEGFYSYEPKQKMRTGRPEWR